MKIYNRFLILREEKVMKSYIKVPMIAAIILEALIVLISMIMYFNQTKIIRNMSGSVPPTGKVFPSALLLYISMLILYIIYFLIMATYDGSSCRGVGNGMLAAWIVFNIAYPYASSVQSKITAMKGSDSLAAVSILTSQISIFVTPFSVIASALVLLAVGRFSVESEYREAAPMGINPAVFGQGYIPAQGYTPVQEYTPVQGYTPTQGNVPEQNDQQGQ